MKFLSLNIFTGAEEVIDREETKQRMAGHILNIPLALMVMEKDHSKVFETPRFNIKFYE